jgi:hypothetical protein
MGFAMDGLELGQLFSEYFGFPCQFSFHRLFQTHYLSSGAGKVAQILTGVPSGLSLNLSQRNVKQLCGSENWDAPSELDKIGGCHTSSARFVGSDLLAAYYFFIYRK